LMLDCVDKYSVMQTAAVITFMENPDDAFYCLLLA
ncbi:MAG: hypothetical protein ACJA0M_002513, partial [Chitinophagales bacterium]